MINQYSVTVKNKKYICQPVNDNYICRIIRTQFPVIEIAYNVLTKKGILTGAASNDEETKSAFKETLEWAQNCVRFDEQEIENLGNDHCIQHVYKGFAHIPQSNKELSVSLHLSLNECPVL